MGFLAVTIWFAQLFAIFIGPSIALLLYGFFAADRDAYSILNVISALSPDHKLITRGLFLVLYIYASFVFLNSRRKYGYVVRVCVFLVQVLSVFIVIGCFVKGYDLIKALSTLVYTGLPVVVIWIVASFSKSKKYAFFGFVFIQIGLAVAVIFIPQLNFLDGSTYKALEGVYVVEGADGAGFSDASFDKYAVGRYAQFHNQNALGFYSCAALALGVSLLSRGRTSAKLASLLGLSYCMLGALGWLNSLTRGPMILLVFGVLGVFVFFRAGSKERARKIVGVLVLGVFLMLAVFTTDLVAYLFPDSSNVSVTTRFEGYEYGWLAIQEHGFWGVPDTWVWPELAYPHMLPLSFAADYGLLAGVMIFAIVFGGGFVIMLRAFKMGRQNVDSGCYALPIYLVMIVWGAALTNNLIGPVLFWLCFVEAGLIVFGARNHKLLAR